MKESNDFNIWWASVSNEAYTEDERQAAKAGWQAAKERYGQRPPKNEGYGCHCDLEPHMKPDNCVIDMGALRNCVYAEKLIGAGKGRDDCEYWQPITLINGGATKEQEQEQEQEQKHEQ